MTPNSYSLQPIGVARRAQESMPLPKFLQYLVILRFERRYPKQNTVAHLKSNILARQFFWAGYATPSTANFTMRQQTHKNKLEK